MSLILTLRKQRQEEEFYELEVDKGGPLSEVLASLLYIVSFRPPELHSEICLKIFFFCCDFSDEDRTLPMTVRTERREF